jgi:hypothetical protein
LPETIKSKLFWIAVSSLTGLSITEGYNLIKSQISIHSSYIPDFIPIMLGIVGTGLLGYILIQNKRKKERPKIEESKIIDKIKEQQEQEESERNREEIRRLEEGEPESQRQKGNRDRYTPTGFK